MGLLKMTRIFLILATFCQLNSCAKGFSTKPKGEPSVERVSVLSSEQLAGKYLDADDKSVSLLSDGDPVLVMFATDSCAPCRKEAEEMAAFIKANGLPTKLKVVSILVGANRSDLLAWSESFGKDQISWVRGTDPDMELFNQFFEELVTPATVYIDLQANKVIRWQAPVTIPEIQRETSPWF
jgi:thiol-disulfide isomerase/thioredoxin